MSVAAVLTAAATLAWFGPAQISFDAELPGNPYDSQANDVRVRFIAADGHVEERLAYFDDGHWKAWLATPHPADYVATLMRNDAPVDVPPVSLTIRDTTRVTAGYVQVHDGRFVTDAGTPYFPLGHNLGWQQPDSPTLTEQIRDMGHAGMNWTRIWACAFDEKNPFYSRTTPPPPPGALLPAPLQRWDELIATAEAAGVRLQLVLFHHGLFSTTVNSNWDEHPWNAANGGFLTQPQEFFTDPTARNYTRRWLRHAVARWAHSPAIMAWELFNEVEWVDLVREDHDWATVAAWHAEMAAYLRTLDPHRHLITTSSATEHPALYDAMDFAQPHLYTRNLTIGIAGARPPLKHPWFFGEFGGNAFGPAAPNERQIVRDGLWASVLADQPGAAGYWYWERVAQHDLADEFTQVGRVLALSHLPARLEARPLHVGVAGARPAALNIVAGRSWAKTERHTFDLPADAAPAQLAELSSFLRAPDPKTPAVSVPPLELRFTAPAAAQATITLAAVGPKGGMLQVLLDGEEVARPSWPPVPNAAPGVPPRRGLLAPITVDYAAGSHVLTLRSLGPDWVQFDRIALADLGRTSTAMAIGADNFVIARICTTAEGIGATLDLTFPGLQDGQYQLHEIDLETRQETQRTVRIVEATLPHWPAAARDVVVVLRAPPSVAK